jgi:hypothetical protein
VPYAELQSMLLDSLVGDAAWRATYARTRRGDPLPWALHEEELRATHPYQVAEPGGDSRATQAHAERERERELVL